MKHEIKELKNYYSTIKGKLNNLENELSRLVATDDKVVLLLYSRRSLEVIVREICTIEKIKISNTIPLKGIIDKLNKEQKVPSNIITAMLNLNSNSVYGAHPKEFDERQVRTTLINLASVIEWFITYKGIDNTSQPELGHLDSEPVELHSSPKDGSQKKSIIVLPFENMSSDPEQEYFSDGLTEEIITDLSYIHDLLVISRSSAMTFKGSKQTIKEIAQKVDVTHVLEGSVRKAGNKLRITAQLIEAESDTHLWAEKFDGVIDDVFEIQEKVAASIAEKLKIKFTSDEKKHISDRQFKNTATYEWYIKARHEVYLWNETALNNSIKYLHKALETEGDNSILYAELANVYYQFWNFGVRLDENDLKQARRYIEKAFALNADCPDALFISSLVEVTGGDLKVCIKNLKRTLEITPHHENATVWLSAIDSFYAGNLVPNILEDLIKINPFHPFINWVKPNLKIQNGHMHEAAKIAEQFAEDAIDNYNSIFVGLTYLYNKQFDDTKKLMDKQSDGFKENYGIKLISLHLLALEGEIEKVEKQVDDQFLLWANKDFQYSFTLAQVFAIMNQKERAIDCVENSVKRGFINYPFLNEYNHFLENIRGEERFKKLMQKVKYEWENFEV